MQSKKSKILFKVRDEQTRKSISQKAKFIFSDLDPQWNLGHQIRNAERNCGRDTASVLDETLRSLSVKDSEKTDPADLLEATKTRFLGEKESWKEHKTTYSKGEDSISMRKTFAEKMLRWLLKEKTDLLKLPQLKNMMKIKIKF